jgi:hypothetical protein
VTSANNLRPHLEATACLPSTRHPEFVEHASALPRGEGNAGQSGLVLRRLVDPPGRRHDPAWPAILISVADGYEVARPTRSDETHKRPVELNGLSRTVRRRSCFRPARRCPHAATSAAAAAIPDEVIIIFLAVIVGYFLPRRDRAQCHKHDLSLAHYRLGIWPAGMVHVTRNIPARGAVDRPSAVEFEHVFCALPLAPLRFLNRKAAAAIGRDVGGPFDHLCGEQAKAGRRPADAEKT